jgi:flagellar biosynthesis protein FlhB
MAQSDKTEEATPKRKAEAHKKGQVAKSQDLTGSTILLAGLFALGVSGPSMVQNLGAGVHDALAASGGRDPVTINTIGDLMMKSGQSAVSCLAPVVGICAAAAIVINIVQVGVKPRSQALKPNFKRLDPKAGIKKIIGKDGLVELVKNLVKLGIVGGVVLSALLPHIGDYAAMVGVSPIEFGSAIVTLVRSVAKRAAFAFLFIGVFDYIYQRYRHKQSLKMEKSEVKEESKGQDLPAEVKSAIRQRQREQARARMMADVPTADVIVTNPTHFSVALKYDGRSAAPTVIAKGQDLMALKIREIAADAEVPIVPDPPLARSLHDTVEVGQMIPEDLFHAVAQILAYVYRVAGRRRLSA